jgi:hypothetical protein
MTNRTSLMVWLALIALGDVAAAADKVIPLKMDNADKARFEEQAASVHKAMEPGGRFEFVGIDERNRVEQALTEIADVLAKHEPAVALRQDEKVAIFNAQEVANAILLKNDGDRLICKNEAPMGSHRKQTTCNTVAELRRVHEHDSDLYKNKMNPPLPLVLKAGDR